MNKSKSSISIIFDTFDTLFFRDGRPFSMGDDTWADGIFPPPLSVIYGALRTGYFAQNICLFPEAGEPDDPTSGLRINKICYRVTPGNLFCYPAPLDFMELKDKHPKDRVNESVNKRYSIEKIKLVKDVDGCSSLDEKNLSMFRYEGEVESVENGLIDFQDLTNYLCNGSLCNIIKLSDHICKEPKVGIGRSDLTRTSGDTGKLYRIGLQRPASRDGQSRFEVVVEFEDLQLAGNGILRLGGEGKCVSYFAKPSPEIDISPLRTSEDNRFKLYFLTPAVFDKGWIASWMEIGEYRGLGINLLGAVVGKPLFLGGFDIRAQKPKIMRKAVPAGSVYYFELKDGTVKSRFEELKNAFHGKSLADESSATFRRDMELLIWE